MIFQEDTPGVLSVELSETESEAWGYEPCRNFSAYDENRELSFVYGQHKTRRDAAWRMIKAARERKLTKIQVYKDNGGYVISATADVTSTTERWCWSREDVASNYGYFDGLG